jgi:hypothetical protein
MVWAELKLGKVVDWTTLKAAPIIHILTQRNITQCILKYPKGGLSIQRTQLKKPDTYVSNNSSIDSNFDENQSLNLPSNPAAIASRRLQHRKEHGMMNTCLPIRIPRCTWVLR